MGATAMLGDYVASAGRTPLPAATLRKAAYCMLDAIGVGLMASQEATVQAVSDIVGKAPPASLSSVRHARIWADGRQASLADAALVNAVAVHAQFHDDTDYASWTHPGSLIVPMAVTLADARGATLAQTLRAVVAGYNSLVWLGAAGQVGRAIIDRGLRASPVLGAVAATATAAVLLELDRDQAINAIGIAASTCGGTLEPVRCGSDEWRIQNARAATGGLLAAQLAQRGVKGAPAGLEGPRGLLAALAGLDREPLAWQTPPAADGILGVVAKPWATLGDNMSAVIAAKRIHDQGLDVGSVARIDITIWRHFTEYPGTAYRGPYDRVTQAVASMAFGVAAMLVHGELDYDIPFARRNDPAILRLVPLVHIQPDDQGNTTDATVVVTLSNGREIASDARDAGTSMLHHDDATSIALFERRLAHGGQAAGAGRAMAEAMLAASTHDAGTTLHDWLAALYP